MSTGYRCRGFYYTIKNNDTLYSIAKRYGVRVADILGCNPGIDIYNLRIGSRILIPGRNIISNPFVTIITYIVKENDTIKAILDRFGIELGDLLRYNEINGMNLTPGTTLRIPVSEEETEEQ